MEHKHIDITGEGKLTDVQFSMGWKGDEFEIHVVVEVDEEMLGSPTLNPLVEVDGECVVKTKCDLLSDSGKDDWLNEYDRDDFVSIHMQSKVYVERTPGIEVYSVGFISEHTGVMCERPVAIFFMRIEALSYAWDLLERLNK